MANESHNPLSRLLDIDFPDVKRANWNCSYDLQTTSDVGYVKPVFTDRILANTHVKLDINQASFANPTVSPLYGRYRVKYLAFWAPDRIYIPAWRDGDIMVDDNYPYPVVTLPVERPGSTYFEAVTHYDMPYVPVSSLLSYLGMFPANFDPSSWHSSDLPDAPNALPLLAFWDIYRHYIVNPQESTFPIRIQSFRPEHINAGLVIQASNPVDVRPSRENLDNFFRAVRSALSDGSTSINAIYRRSLQHDIFSRRYLSSDVPWTQISTSQDVIDNCVLLQDYHYGLPMAPYGSDMFTSWVSNENVELERNASRVNIPVMTNNNQTYGVMTMDSWVLASRIQNKVRKTIFKNSDFSQYIDVQYGIKPPTDLTKPMFLGAFVSDIVFNDVISSVQGENADGSSPTMNSNRNLGSRAGYGRGTDREKNEFIEFTSREPGTLMILQIITPEVFYYEGQDPMWRITNFNEEFNPCFDGVGFTPLETFSLNAVPHLMLDPQGRICYNDRSYADYNTSIGQQPYGMHHMAKVNQLSGQMAEYGSYLTYSLARSFNYVRSLYENQQSSRTDYYSSYIIPEMFTNIFKAYTQDNFQFYLNFDYLKYQPISKQFLAFNN